MGRVGGGDGDFPTSLALGQASSSHSFSDADMPEHGGRLVPALSPVLLMPGRLPGCLCVPSFAFPSSSSCQCGQACAQSNHEQSERQEQDRGVVP